MGCYKGVRKKPSDEVVLFSGRFCSKRICDGCLHLPWCRSLALVLAGDIRFFPDKISQKRGKVGFSSKETMLDAQNMLPEAKLIDDVQKHIETTGLKQKSLWSNALKDTFP